MFIVSIILALLLIWIVIRPAKGPFTKQLQLIWGNAIGKIVIVGVLIVIAIL